MFYQSLIHQLYTRNISREAHQSRRSGDQLLRDVLKQSVTEQELVRPTPKIGNK